MSVSKRFKPVQVVADNKERKAATALGHSIKEQNTEEQKLIDLKNYHAEYMDKLRVSGEKGVSVPLLREYQAFLNKLDRAITEQKQKVERSKQCTIVSRKTWQKNYTKSKAMEKAVDRMRDEEGRVANRIEQKNSDEHAGRRRIK